MRCAYLKMNSIRVHLSLKSHVKSELLSLWVKNEGRLSFPERTWHLVFVFIYLVRMVDCMHQRTQILAVVQCRLQCGNPHAYWTGGREYREPLPFLISANVTSS